MKERLFQVHSLVVQYLINIEGYLEQIAQAEKRSETDVVEEQREKIYQELVVLEKQLEELYHGD